MPTLGHFHSTDALNPLAFHIHSGHSRFAVALADRLGRGRAPRICKMVQALIAILTDFAFYRQNNVLNCAYESNLIQSDGLDYRSEKANYLA